jgi:hypothetical protein
LNAQNRDLITLKLPQKSRKWNFFIGKSFLQVSLSKTRPLHITANVWSGAIDAPAMTTSTFPDDLDTTSLGLTIFTSDPADAKDVMDEMLQYVNQNGIIMVCA